MSKFAKQTLERAGKTFAQVFLATYLAGIGPIDSIADFANSSVADKAAVAAIGAVLSIVMSLLSRPFGEDKNSPSAV